MTKVESQPAGGSALSRWLLVTRLRPIAELLGPVVTDESKSNPLFMGADGHSNNTGELQAT
jgi:hypothetical protein